MTATHQAQKITMKPAGPVPWLISVLVLGLAGFCLADINVNIDVTNRTGLVGPAGGLPWPLLTWNQQLGVPGLTASGLLDAYGATTTVGFTLNAGFVDPWGAPGLKLLTSAAFQWNWSTPANLVIDGLAPDREYDLYLASFYPNENGSRTLFSTSNTTTTVGIQIVDTGGPNGNDSTWIQGTNFARFENIEPDSSGKITVTMVGDTGKRAYLSGFQLVVRSVAVMDYYFYPDGPKPPVIPPDSATVHSFALATWEDAAVDANAAATAFGADEWAHAESGYLSRPDAQLLFKFVDAYGLMAGDVESATLHLYLFGGSSAATAIGFTTARAASGWNEASVTWNSRPSLGTASTAYSGTPAMNNIVTLDVTVPVAAEQQADAGSRYGIVVSDSAGSSPYVVTKESQTAAYRPFLHVGVVPEPTVLIVLASVGIAMLRGRPMQNRI